MTAWNLVARAIGAATGSSFSLVKAVSVSGGDINESYRLTGLDGRSFFLKLNTAAYTDLFAAEAAGLAAIADTNAIRVPHVVTHGITDQHSFLILEHLDLGCHGNSGLLGERLAALHRCLADQFGFKQNNFIGRTLQANDWSNDWVAFWREQRLGRQLQLAERKGFAGRLQEFGAELLAALPAFFAGYTPQPSLLHGDLWSGNHGFLADGSPAIFDPAAYYGDRECDLAMTELFGGYNAEFYAAYRSAWPLDQGYTTRRELYNLYHILNHANLFGGGYARQAEHTMQRLLACTR